VFNPNWINFLISNSTPDDRALLSGEDKRLWRVTTAETFAQGMKGLEYGLLEGFAKFPPNGWGFDVRDIGVLVLLHGDQDLLTSIYASRELAELTGKGSEVVEFKGVGHFGIVKLGFEYVRRQIGKQTPVQLRDGSQIKVEQDGI
jgi:hypothetical protein